MTWGVELYWYVAGPGGGRWPFRVQLWRVRLWTAGAEEWPVADLVLPLPPATPSPSIEDSP